MSDLRTIIAKWLDYPPSVMEAVFETPVEDIFRVVIDLLETGDEEIIGEVFVFIRDAVQADKNGFRHKLDDSSLITALEKQVFSGTHMVRDQAVYTLAKIGATNSIPVLRRAFDYYLVSDPLLLPRLVLEMHWLGALDAEPVKVEPFIEVMLRSDCYLTRWAVLEILDHLTDNSRYLVWLSTDQDEYIRREADYQRRRWDIRKQVGLSKSQKRALSKELQHLKPFPTFMDLTIRFRGRFHQDLVNAPRGNLDKLISLVDVSER